YHSLSAKYDSPHMLRFNLLRLQRRREIFSDLILSVICNDNTLHKNQVMSRFVHTSLIYIKG
ncbi:hypothetical protein, partial [Alteromonas sp. KUL106]|uniref:hypothetical protein n=1 Tax=Alteromonas sp. KUL106 TaxID=2480799 RepID=UPI001F35DB96